MIKGHHDAEPVAALPPQSAQPWPLVGRERDMALALEALVERHGVVLVGEAGTGKTRLASEITAATGRNGFRWHVVIGSQGAARVPLGAWSHLLPDTWQPGVDDLATWRSLATSLEATGGAIHLFVDDAQWLDPVSAGLVHHLVATGQARAVVTVRRDAGVSQPITALWKDGHLVRHDLELLDLDQTTEVLEVVLGAPVEPRTARRLHRRSTGNLLMVRELVEAGRADETLQLRHGAWVQAPSTRPSPRLVDLLADRIENLTPAERAGAELVAVAEPIDAELLEQALGEDLVRRLVTGRVVDFDRTGPNRVVRSSHPLVAEVLVDGMDEARHEEVLRTLVELAEQASVRTDADLVRIAVWRLEAGLPIEASRALEVADLAFARSDVALAETLARVAVDAGAGPAAAIRLGEALHSQERSAEAEGVLAAVADHLDELDLPLRLRYAEARALALRTDLGRLDDAIVVLEDTLATMPDDRVRWALEARLAFVLSDCGRLRAAEPLAEARMAAREEDEVSALLALTAFTTIRTLSGRARDSLAALDAMVPTALAHLDDVPPGIGWIAAQRMLALYFLGELPEAETFSAAVEAMVVDDVDPTRRAAVLMVRGMLAADAGRLDEALRLLQQSAALHELDNHRGYQAWTLALLSRVHAQLGQVDVAEEALVQARRALWPSGQVIASELEVAAMWVAGVRSRLRDVHRLAWDAIDHADREGMTMVSAYIHHEAVRLGLPAAAHIDALAAAADVDQGPRAAIWRDHAAALAADDSAGLVDAGHRFAALGTHLIAAEAFARAAGSYLRAGAPARASQAKELSRRERDLCAAARTPGLQSSDLVVGLTARELDVAARAAAGDSNLEIAAALGISVRTVETHLQRAFLKLGVKRRTALAAVLHPD